MSSKRASLASLVGQVSVTPNADPRQESPARTLRTDLCIANPRNPRDDIGDLEDLAGIVDRQLQSCLGVTRRAFLNLWPEDESSLGSSEYVIVNGNRRWAAARKFGRPELLVVVDDDVASSKATLLRAALDENTARKDFDPIEEAKAVMAVVTEYPTAKEAAQAQNWKEAWVSQRKALLNLPSEVQAMVRAKARGGDGMAIEDARWLGGQIARGAIGDLSTNGLLAVVQARRQQAADKRAEEKLARQTAKQAPPAGSQPPEFTAANRDEQRPPTMAVKPASVIEEEAGRERFAAVNQEPDRARPVPEPRQSPAPVPTAAAAAPVPLEPSLALSASMVEAARVLVAADPLAAAKALAQVASSTWLEESSLQLMNLVDDARTTG